MSPSAVAMPDVTPQKPRALELPKDGIGSFGFWKQEAAAAKQFIEDVKSQRKWEDNLKAWSASTKGYRRNDVVVPKDFTLVQQKGAMLFFQTAEVQLTAKKPEYANAVPVFQAVVNYHLGPSGVDALSLVDQLMPDILNVAGVGISKIGYEAIQDGTVDVPRTGPDGQPIVNMFTGQPEVDQAPNIVSERYFWERISPGRFLCPPTHFGPWDKAPWLGFWFEDDAERLEKIYGVEIHAKGGDTTEGLLKGDFDLQQVGRSRTKARGYEIWYRAADVDPEIKTPDLMRQLVWFDGQEEPAVHRDSPYQSVENGKVVSGMKGNPIHVLTLRDMPDHAFPPSDSSVTRPLVDELSQGRTQMMQARRRAMSLRAVDLGRLGVESVEKLLESEYAGLVPSQSWDANNPPISQIANAQFPRENFTFNDYIDRDISESWALGSPQLGSESQGAKTATEMSMMQQATNVRMDKERGRVLRWFTSGAEKLAALIQMFADNEDYVMVTDQAGAQQLAAWDKRTIAGQYVFSAKANSQLRLDAAGDVRQTVDLYNMMRQDSRIMPEALIDQVARKHNLDPAKLIAPPPEPPPPEPPKVGLSFKGEDLSPLVFQYPNVVAVLQALGGGQLQLQPAMTAPETVNPAEGMDPHGGAMPQQQPINKHTADRTGNLPGGWASQEAMAVQ